MKKGKTKTFGIFLKALRLNRGESLKKLAPKLAVNYSYLSKLENGHTLPSEEFLEKISKVFNFDQEELMVRAGKLPDDIIEILTKNPSEAISVLRKEFGD